MFSTLSGVSGFGSRHVLAIMSFLGFMNLYSMRVSFNVALVAMVSHNVTNAANNGSEQCPQSNMTSGNSTNGNEVSYNSKQRAIE